MATEIGVAYLSIVPSLDGASRELQKQLGAAESDVARKGKFGSKIWRGLKVGAVAAGAGIAGVLTGSIAKGFQRLSAIEDAEAKLTGLGHSGEEVQKIMDSALAAVKGTAYGMGDAASLSATMVAAGIEPGKDLENTLRLVADSATIAGRDLSDMGLIWGQVASKGKLTGEDAMQIMEAGIPIWQLVGKEMGVTAGEAQELASKGEVSFDIFRRAMESGLGGAALESGKTVRGAFSNMGAAMGRFGATLLEKVYPLIGPVLGKITDLFDYLTDAAGPAIDKIIEKATPFVDALKGIWSILANGDFKGGIFGIEEDHWFIGFLFGVRDVALELYEKALKPLGTWIGNNWKLIGSVLGGIAAFFMGGALVAAIGAVGGAIAAFIGGISWIGVAIGTVIGGLTYFFTQTEAGQEIVSKAWGFIKQAVAGVVDWFTTTAWPALQKGWDILKVVASEVIPVVIDYVKTLGSYWSQIFMGVILPAIKQFADYLINTMWPIVQRVFVEYIGPAIVAAWFVIKPALTALFAFMRDTLAPTIVWLWQNVVSPAFTAIGALIAWAWNSVIFPALDAMKWFLVNVVAPAMVTLWQFTQKAWTNIQTVIRTVVSWFQTWAWPVISLVVGLIKVGFSTMRDALQMVWFKIRHNIINPVVVWFQGTAWPIISSVLKFITDGFEMMRFKLSQAWSAIRLRIIQPVVTWFENTVKPKLDAVTGAIGDAFDTMKDVVGKAWDGVKDAAKAPIRFVVETVVNDALIGNFNKVADKLGVKKLPSVSLPYGFARGGVLPGWSRMRDGDDQLVPMRRGEGVLVSEGLRRAKDKAAFLAVNAAARRGIGFSDLMGGGFAGGGIWDGVKGIGRRAKEIAGDALDKVLEGVDFVAEAIKDPSAMFTKVYDAVIGSIPAAGLVTDVAKASGKKLVDGIVSTVLGAFGPGSDADVGPMPAGASRSLSYAQSVASSMGLTMTSFRRPGARTAGSGVQSLHALGRAKDFSNSSGPTPQMMRFFNAMHPLKPTELLYSPAGARQWRRSGRMADTSGATKRGHYNHVHVGFADGGLVGKPFLHDRGGWHTPGELSVNQTRKPEAILTDSQWKTMSKLAERNLASGQTIVQVMPPSTEDPGIWGHRVADSLDLHRLAAETGGL